MDAAHPRPQPPQWLWIVTIWSAVGLFDATQNVFVMRAQGWNARRDQVNERDCF